MQVLMTENVTSGLREFIHTIINGMGGDFLFDIFDSPLHVIGSLLDIAVTAAVIYFALKLFADSRAWQLMKGFLFIIVFTAFCSAAGLTTINYILSNSISILVIGFVVVFQPELRTALEAVGRNSLQIITNVSQDTGDRRTRETALIESIVMACDSMGKTKTGALIILERTTSLGDLIKNSPAAVILNADLTATALEQIFYKNSPLHDGALLLRAGRIYAARCHVPLSDTYHLRKDIGTRHRAAIGASEISDAICIVVSEERGTISITIDGRLYLLEGADALRAILHKILLDEVGSEEATEKSKGALDVLIKSVKFVGSTLGVKHHDLADDIFPVDKEVKRRRRMRNIGLKVASVVLSIGLYVYVQTVTNPIEKVTFTQLPITIEGMDLLDQQGYKLVSSQKTANIVIRARRQTLEKFSNNTAAVVTYVKLQPEQVKLGSSTWKVRVKIDKIPNTAYKIFSIDPMEVSVTVTDNNNTAQRIMPGEERRGTGGLEKLDPK